MVVHYFTLKALANELDLLLRGARVVEVYSQQKNELTIAVDIASEDRPSVAVSVDAAFNYIVLRKQHSRAKKNSADLFPEIVETKIEHVGVPSYDRVVEFRLQGNLTMLLQLYDTAASNILLLDRERRIRESFKRRSEFVGTIFLSAEERFADCVLEDQNVFVEFMLRDPAKQVLAALKQTVPLLGAVYAREVLFRTHIDEKANVCALSDTNIGMMLDEVKQIFHQVASPKPRIYFKDRHPEFLSLIPLRHFPIDSHVEEFEHVHDAVTAFVQKFFRAHGTEEQKGDLLGRLRDAFHRAARSLEAAHRQLEHATRADEYEYFGKLLLANIQASSKGMKEVTVDDFISAEGRVTIALEPWLSAAGNAGRYFEKAKKARAARKETEGRVAGLTGKVGRLEALVAELDDAETLADVKEFARAHRDELRGMKLMTAKPNEPPPPFRIFAVAGGLEVWVGKNSANNDLLTTKYAKPNDLWFHVRGAGGSHTVLKVAGSTPPPRESVRQAASIAAYYSKMRNAGTVPVAYCERKYVRKPKGVKEGTVVIEREKTVFVKPQLP